MIRVLLADDHPLILRGVHELLERRDDIHVVGEVPNPEDVLPAVDRLSPDILVQDLAMHGRFSGLELIRDVRDRHPGTRIVVLTVHANIETVWDTLEAGASAYVTKLGEFDELVQAIHAVDDGGRFLGTPFTPADLDEYAAEVAERGLQTMDSLTRREREVLGLVAIGQTSNEIADRLHISRRTVESHRANVSAKLGLRNQAELTRYAMVRGLIGSEPMFRSANAQ